MNAHFFNWTYFLLTLTGMFFFGCNSGEKNSTPTSGKFRLAVDETIQTLGSTLVDGFEHIYDKASVHTEIANENQCVTLFARKEVDMVLLSRDLTPQETRVITSQQYIPKRTIIGVDAIVLICNKSTTVNSLSVHQLKQILNGTVQTWRVATNSDDVSPIRMAVDQSGSSLFRWLQDECPNLDTKMLFAAGSQDKVLQYVESHPGALGFISFSKLSDEDDARTRAISSAVKVLGIQVESDSIQSKTILPDIESIRLLEYPLIRKLYLINREGHSGLAQGFSAFAAGEVGQRLIQMEGLIPYYKVPRDVELYSDPIKIVK